MSNDHKSSVMRFLLYILLPVFMLQACSASKNYLERNDVDKALQDAVKKLNKDASDEKASQALPILYSNIKQKHLEKIKSYSNSKDLARWDKIISSYENLQDAYGAIINSPAAFRLVTPESYQAVIFANKELAAGAYYGEAQTQLSMVGRDHARKAYNYFKKADKFMPGYKDAKLKMKEAYESAVVNVVINPVEDNSFFFNSGFGNYGYNYSNQYFQETLVRELNGNSDRYAARFFTEWEARRESVRPDWLVELRLRNLDVPYPITNTSTRSRSAQVQVGTDTAGKPVYQTVYATLTINQMSFTARADMEVNIRDIAGRKNISNRSFRDDYRWDQSRATYSGDSRALTQGDWQMINNNLNAPRKEEVLNELYRKIYPQVLNNIRYAAEW
jgi:hypothetical protein